MCRHRTEARPSRRYACGIVALRPDRDGVIAGHDDADEVFARHGDHLVGHHFPEPGRPTQGVEAGYRGNAWLRVHHEDHDALRCILTDIGERVQVRAR